MKKLDLTKSPEEVVAEMSAEELQGTLDSAQRHDEAISRRNRKAYQGSGKKRLLELQKYRLAKFKAAKERKIKENLQRDQLGR